MDTTADLETSVADWAIDYPAAVPIFESLGIDYCCGGKSLRHACAQAGREPETVFKQLQAAIGNEHGR